MRRFFPLVLVVALAAVMAGCASPRSSFYTLSPTAKAADGGADYSVAVGPVSVPAEVDRQQIVVRLAPNRVSVEEFHRWASPLPDAIAGVVAENLSAMLGTPHVALWSRPMHGGARYRVLLDVVRFDSAPGESAVLDVIWMVRGATGTAAGRTTVGEPVPDREYAALAAAHSRALGRLSGEIAEAIRGLEQDARR